MLIFIVYFILFFSSGSLKFLEKPTGLEPSNLNGKHPRATCSRHLGVNKCNLYLMFSKALPAHSLSRLIDTCIMCLAQIETYTFSTEKEIQLPNLVSRGIENLICNNFLFFFVRVHVCVNIASSFSVLFTCFFTLLLLTFI